MIAAFYLAALLIPGGIIYSVAGGKRHWFLYSFGIGMLLLVPTQIFHRIAGGPVRHWYAIVAITWMAALFVALAVRLRNGGGNTVRRGTGAGRLLRRRKATYLSGMLATAAFVGIYLACAGVYTEVPADFWFHMMRVNWERWPLEAGRFSIYGLGVNKLLNRDYVHSLHALFAQCLGQTTLAAAPQAMMATTLLFVTAVYWFVVGLFREELRPTQKSGTAIGAALLTAAGMGVGVFSYIRYYAYAPSILNMVLLMAWTLAWHEALRVPRRRTASLAFAFALLVTMALIHLQEAIFALVIGGLMCVHDYFRKSRLSCGDCTPAPMCGVRMFALVTAIAFVAALVVAHHYPAPAIRDPHYLHLGAFLRALDGFYILLPSGRVYAVLTSFGIAVYFAAMLYWNDLSRNGFVVAGLSSPLVTVFNPLFVTAFTRVDAPESLWRMVFMVPVGIVAARIIALAVERMRSGAELRAKIKSVAALGLLLVAVPFDGDRGDARLLDRWVTLKPFNDSDGIHWLEDVLRWFEGKPARQVISDPVTSYVLRSATRQHVYGFKFSEKTSGYNIRALSGENGLAWLEPFKGGYIVVNRREGSASEAGRRSLHWPESVRSVSRWYPDGFEDELNRNPQRFKLVWQVPEISIYEIHGDASGSSAGTAGTIRH